MTDITSASFVTLDKSHEVCSVLYCTFWQMHQVILHAYILFAYYALCVRVLYAISDISREGHSSLDWTGPHADHLQCVRGWWELDDKSPSVLAQLCVLMLTGVCVRDVIRERRPTSVVPSHRKLLTHPNKRKHKCTHSAVLRASQIR